ncbi:autoinducer binding domain-containing protein [Amaricoccus sp. W119]|uniref:autoinducer binding domain-containing protein n=1 Tax=Amaricoccus sp. W119 TaxID=3391833 RepID=UPI0039A73AFD
MDVDRFESFVQAVLSTDELWRALVRFARARGVDKIGYHHMPPVGAPDDSVSRIRNAGFPAEWVEYYFAARQAGTLPITDHARRHGKPVYWDDIETLRELTADERAHLAKLRAAGFVYGLAVPAYGPNGRNGIFEVALAAGVERLDPPVLAELNWACQATHLRYCALILPDIGVPPPLSRREKEVLTWVARGKSNAAIAAILGISAHTVDAHLRRIYQKLGVFDRISAALRGIGYGLITSEA